MTMPFAGWITACIAHYQCHRYVKRAVESLLQQTYPWIRIIVINDGDPHPPWKELASLNDPRILRFDLRENHGPYFCFEVARRATPDPYFMMQDADDWAAPRRAAALLRILLDEESDLAVSAQPQFREAADGSQYQTAIRWNRMSRADSAGRFVIKPRITDDFDYRVPHAGLIRTSALRDIGGYFGGFRVGYDILLTNLVLMTGSVSWTPEPLYYRLVRAESLTHCNGTGPNSDYAAAVTKCLRQLYKDSHGHFIRYRAGKMSRPNFLSSVKQVCGRYVSSDDMSRLTLHARQLRRAMT
jgi:glycosyltransferase involved in cell wall biosynthesis